MRKSVLAFLALAAALPLAAAVQTWTNVSLVDQKCSAKFNPSTVDTHTRTCALSCASSGYGILTEDGTFLKFDTAGSQEGAGRVKGIDEERSPSRHCDRRLGRQFDQG